MYVEYPRTVPVVCLPDTAEQFVTRHSLASPSHEQSQDLAGDGRKLVQDTVNLEPSRSRVQRHTLCLHNVGRMSHQGRLDRLDQLVHCERSGQESIHLARNRLTGLQQSQHGNLKAKFQARHAAGTTRRRQVKDQKRWPKIERLRLGSTGHPADAVLLRVERPAQMLSQRLGASDHQQCVRIHRLTED